MTETSVKVIITYIRVEEVTLNNSLKDKTSMTLRLKGIKKLKFLNRYIFAIFNISNLENGLKIYGLKNQSFSTTFDKIFELSYVIIALRESDLHTKYCTLTQHCH